MVKSRTRAMKVMVAKIVIVTLVFVDHSSIWFLEFRFFHLCIDGDQ